MNSEKQQQQSNPQDTSRKNPQTDTRDRLRQGGVQPDQRDRKADQGPDDQRDKSKKTA
jgi:hypothetical protein